MADSHGAGADGRPGTTRLLFVCLGNICRSPMAEGVMRTLVEQAGVQDGRARQIRREDFQDFDLMVAMDSENLRELRRLAPGREEREKVRLLREFDPAAGVADGAAQPSSRPLASRAAGEDLDVPDPYYGAADGFEEVLDLVYAACVGLLAQIQNGQVS